MIARRYERASTVLTSNNGFEESGEVFSDEVMAAALIDGLLHHCHIINIRGNPYRIRHPTELWRSLNAGDSASAASPRTEARHRLCRPVRFLPGVDITGRAPGEPPPGQL
jgi:hypothetical protein